MPWSCGRAPETLALYPYSFRLAGAAADRHGFSTAVTVANPGRGRCLILPGPHRLPCPQVGEVRDYRAGVFPRRRAVPPCCCGTDCWTGRRAPPCLEDTDTLPLTSPLFDALDTHIVEGLRSLPSTLRSRKSGRGVRVSFDRSPPCWLWDHAGEEGPLSVHGAVACSAGTGGGEGIHRIKAHCIVLAPREPHPGLPGGHPERPSNSHQRGPVQRSARASPMPRVKYRMTTMTRGPESAPRRPRASASAEAARRHFRPAALVPPHPAHKEAEA